MDTGSEFSGVADQDTIRPTTEHKGPHKDGRQQRLAR